MEAHLGLLVLCAHTGGLNIVEAVSEAGSGLNGARPKVLKFLANPYIRAIVIEHHDGL